MDILDIMNQRHSTRMYTGEPLTETESAVVSRIIDETASHVPQVNIQLLQGADDGFDTHLDAVSYYGRFRNVPACAEITVSPTNDGLRMAGYVGESLVLALVEHGFDTCWAGGSIETGDRIISAESDEFDAFVNETSRHVDAHDDARFRIAIVIGHALRAGHAHRSKPVTDLLIGSDDGIVPDIEALPDWFLRGMAGVQLAPSALNRQNARFAPGNETGTVHATDVGGLLAKVNTGVAMLHFERTAGIPIEFVIA